ncbi:hypothetical protein PRIPAC_97702 [Pristionchus pacificus]|uniref:Uncharacterized protein n=1 Tax=Pristionchus pacificus TaxID=54126 RepID=A0A2A6D310_PRIPA|nr:hypothetical protein PRIPAC_97702 [Pristionchus pacificus]|eukprot:PDM84671.1 hypothetical protein PRIPAC_33694 [Pristionchus pacificus]
MPAQILPADSILETAVTWGEFEKHIRSALKTDAKLGSSKSVVNIGDGAGLASFCALITCDWICADKDEELPKKVILKIPSVLPMRRMSEAVPKEERVFDSEEGWSYMAQQINKAHNIEIAAYHFFGQFSHLALPKMFYAFRSEKGSEYHGQLCMEFVENTTMMSYTEAHPLKQLKQIARALGKLQAASLNEEPTSPEFNDDIFGDFASIIPKESYCAAFKPLLQFDSSPRMVKAIEDIEKILPDYYGSTLPATIHKQMNYRPVLISGDLAAFIDWQCTRHGVAVEDLLRIQLFGQLPQERRDSRKGLLAEMYNSMLADLDDASAVPYTLEEMDELYDLLMPHCGLYAAFLMPNMMKANLAMPGISDEEREKFRTVQMDKVLGILEDIVAYDDLNKKSAHKLTFITD